MMWVHTAFTASVLCKSKSLDIEYMMIADELWGLGRLGPGPNTLKTIEKCPYKTYTKRIVLLGTYFILFYFFLFQGKGFNDLGY